MQLTGFALTSFSIAFVIYPLLPEVLCITHIKEGIMNDITLVDKASGIYSIFYGIGCILSIIFGNLIITYVVTPTNQMPIGCDVVSFLAIGFGILFFFTNKVYA